MSSNDNTKYDIYLYYYKLSLEDICLSLMLGVIDMRLARGKSYEIHTFKDKKIVTTDDWWSQLEKERNFLKGVYQVASSLTFIDARKVKRSSICWANDICFGTWETSCDVEKKLVSIAKIKGMDVNEYAIKLYKSGKDLYEIYNKEFPPLK